MTGLKKGFGILSILLSLQVILSEDGVIMDNTIEWGKEIHSSTEGNTSLANFLYKRKVREIAKSATDQPISSQIENYCSEMQPCTCYYPDHLNVIIFELSTDAETQYVSGKNGTGPENCEDLQRLGHYLMGFYMVRFNSKRAQTIYCEFNETIKQNKNNKLKTSKRALKDITNKAVTPKKIRFCGGIFRAPCTFYYSDNPDAPLTGKKSTDSTKNNNGKVGPKSCEDLGKIGYFLKGFYAVRYNAIKVKIVYCDFDTKKWENGKTDFKNIRPKVEVKNATISKYCQGIGSQPCSCYFTNSSNILQYELSSDEIARNAPRPENCNDLKQIGHFLDGFYMVRNSEKIMKTIFCKFDTKDKDRKPAKQSWLLKESATEVTKTTKFSSTITQTFLATSDPKVELSGLNNTQPPKPEINNKTECSRTYYCKGVGHNSHRSRNRNFLENDKMGTTTSPKLHQ